MSTAKLKNNPNPTISHVFISKSTNSFDYGGLPKSARVLKEQSINHDKMFINIGNAYQLQQRN